RGAERFHPDVAGVRGVAVELDDVARLQRLAELLELTDRLVGADLPGGRAGEGGREADEGQGGRRGDQGGTTHDAPPVRGDAPLAQRDSSRGATDVASRGGVPWKGRLAACW